MKFAVSKKNFIFQNFDKQNIEGFTLIELLVVGGIILLLSVIIFPNYREGEKQFALQRSAHKLAQDLRRAQEMAMSARESQKRTPPEVPPGGYGIHLTKNGEDYTLYSDGGNKKYGGTGDVDEEIINLEKGIYIKETVPSSASFSINFMPPDPEINIVDAAGTDKNNVTIILALKADPAKTKGITVNKAGLIAIE